MITITKHLNEVDTHVIKCDDIAVFYKSIIDEIGLGWRLYESSIDDTNDITHNLERLQQAKEITMLRPAMGNLIVKSIINPIAAVNKLMQPPKTPTGVNRTQSSNTNSLGDRANEAAINSRVPDIYGFVSRHVPPLLQVPHFRFENGTEVENFAMIVSEGEGEITNIKDGETPFERLNNSKINFWKNGNNPNNNTAPYLSFGGDIDRPLYNVYQSRELQSGELLPPNDISSDNIVWSITGNGTSGTISVTTDDVNFDLNDYFTVDDDVKLNDFSYLSSDESLTIYFGGTLSEDIDVGQLFDLSANSYHVESVNQLTMAVSFSNQSQAVIDVWNSLTGYDILSEYKHLTWSENEAGVYTTDSLPSLPIFSDPAQSIPITISNITVFPSIGDTLAGIVGFYQVPETVTLISFNINASQGYYKLYKNNDTRLLHDFVCIVEETDSEGVPTGNSITYPFTFGSNEQNITAANGKTVDIEMSDYIYQRVGFRRITPRDKSDKVSNADKAILRDLYFYTELENAPDWGDVTIAQVAIYSNRASQGIKDRQINFDFERSIQRYSNGQFEPCRNVADVITAIALDPRNGRLSMSEIDADLFQEVEAQLIDYFGTSEMVEVGYCLDSTKMRFQEIYNMFWRACMCEAYAQGAAYKVYPDILRNDSSKQFTHRNKIIGTDSSESIYDREFDGVELTYRDSLTGQFETVERFINGIDAVNPMQIELTCAINAKQAQVRADRELNILKHQRKTFSFEADGMALLTVPGERVDVVDDSRIVKRENNDGTYSIYSGYVVNQVGLEVQLSEPVYFVDGDLHTIRFTTKKGDLLESIACVAGSSKHHVILAHAPSEPIYIGYKKERTNFTFSADRLRGGLAVLVRGLDAGNKNGIKTRKISGINYSELYYTNDKD